MNLMMEKGKDVHMVTGATESNGNPSSSNYYDGKAGRGLCGEAGRGARVYNLLICGKEGHFVVNLLNKTTLRELAPEINMVSLAVDVNAITHATSQKT